MILLADFRRWLNFRCRTLPAGQLKDMLSPDDYADGCHAARVTALLSLAGSD